MTDEAKITIEVRYDSCYRIVMSVNALADMTAIPADQLLDPENIDDNTMDGIAGTMLEYVKEEWGYPGSGITELWDASEMTLYEVRPEAAL